MSLKLTWYGHAVLGLETGGYYVLVDPFLSDNPSAAISAEQVKPDFILVSHGHGDHSGGAKYLQDHFKTRILLSAADWDLLERTGGPQGGCRRSRRGVPDRSGAGPQQIRR